MLKSLDLFQPVRGTESNILAAKDYTAGKLWFATDTHKIFYGDGETLILMSGGNTGIYYAEFEAAEEVDMTLKAAELESIFDGYASLPVANDLIVKVADNGSCLYRVTGYDEDGNLLIYRLMISGSGGDSGSTKVRGSLEVKNLGEAEILNGEISSFSITPYSATEDGIAIDDQMTLTIQYVAEGETAPYKTDMLTAVYHGTTFTYNAIYLRQSTTTKLTFTLSGSPDNIFRGGGVITRSVKTCDMSISWVDNQFSNHSYFQDSIPVWIQVLGDGSRILDVYFDDSLIYCAEVTNGKLLVSISSDSTIYNYTTKLSTNSTLGTKKYNHGRHTIKAQLSLKRSGSDGARGSSTNFITKEVGVFLQENKPLIWFGDMQEIYYEYDTPIVPIRAYDPNAASDMNIYLYENSVNVSGEEGRVVSKDDTSYVYWELTNLYAGQTTVYQVAVGSGDAQAIERVPAFEVLEDTRHMKIASGAIVNFDARGRSNSESVKKRQILAIRSSQAELKGFNWYNNGWIMDDNKTTCLRISNGASVSLPIGTMTFDGNSNPSHTIELKLKISNVQNYDKMITTYTRYRVKSSGATAGVSGSWKDDEVFAMFKAQTLYSSYDAYLAYILPELRKTDSTIPTYDDLEFARLAREYNLNNAVIKYYDDASGAGICLGAQDGFFTNGSESVSIDFVEDEILNITIVYDRGENSSRGNDNLMKIYLNGMLTSVARSSRTSGAWSINAENLLINSNNCDVDLYKLRVYNSALALTDILKNIAYDNTDTLAWDLTGLSAADNSIKEVDTLSFSAMETYNREHPLAPIMPYIVFTTDDSDLTSKGYLPWRKSITVKADMEFVNTGLDAAYASGDLSAAAMAAKASSVEDYYKHHCPSWKAEGIDLNVQGTSSEFYPRRNYKAKTKVEVVDEEGKKKKVVKMKMNRGPYAQGEPESLEWFYYDNNTVGCNKFTLKVDYMESSGSYNMGLANLVNYAYSHHPLEDYGKKGALSTVDPNNSTLAVATEYKKGVIYSYYNHKGKIKTADGTEDNLIKVESAEQFNKGPMALYQELMASNPALYEKLKVSSTDNNWYEYVPAYMTTTVTDLSDYRTSVQGFPTLAFWQTKSMVGKQDPIFIGRYNMLLDKGASEAYGFKGLKTKVDVNGETKNQDVLSTFFNNKNMEEIAECWEFENNSRGFCSFRDPWNRKNLKFAAPEGVTNQYTVSNAPIVADYFEYRYHSLDDYIDELVDLSDLMTSTKDTRDKVAAALGIKGDLTEANGRQKLLELYGNWEKAVQWVWSTATDAQIDINNDGKLVSVPALNSYTLIDLAEALYEKNKYFYFDSETSEYKKATEDYSEGKSYYLYEDSAYRGIKLTNNENQVYQASKYYTTNENVDASKRVYVLADGAFDASENYYEAKEVTEFDDSWTPWKLDTEVTYGQKTYAYDCKEYRIAKFKDEVEKHFNLEYLVTYFVITEILECYDSRGKNCMVASWGPQESGGEYIWYPIFYDMDTQLGINNTGIPSFEYNIDATDSGCFSTNDSVLWNNLYTTYFNLIREKYNQLKGGSSSNFTGSYTKGGQLTVAPFSNVELIEKIYNCDPTFTNSYSMLGERPLIAMNLDEQYKYISITANPEIKTDENSMRVGYLGSATSPSVQFDSGDTYFYALQGDRSMSREQFLTNRLNYIDSWLALGNYERNGANRIQTRISANDSTNTSDIYVETDNDRYWVDDIEYGTKTHMYDSEYWLTMTPVRDMYVTLGTDTENFTPEKYTGAPVRFTIVDVEKGVRQSPNYGEQLLYIYGLDQMKSLGDLSKLYFKEFFISGNADKLTDLRLGYDGIGDDENNKQYKNYNVNKWTLTGTNGLPLVQEINLCNIQFNAQNVYFDLTKSPKLRNFRNTGSNITKILFAPGVVLDTLYLSDTTTELSLIEARMLTNMIESYEAPVLQSDGTLKANTGLYIDGLTDWVSGDATPNLKRLSLEGGNLGYHSYKLLKKYYDACQADTTSQREVALKDVQWSPYVLVTDTSLAMDTSGQYFYDNGHFGLVPFTTTNTKDEWINYLYNNKLYEYNESLLLTNDSILGETGQIKDTTLLENLINSNIFIAYGSADATSNPDLTGYIYIDNEIAVDEGVIYNTLSVKYPNLHFFFKNVNKGYVVRFVIQESSLIDEGTLITQTLIGTERISKDAYEGNNEIYFTSPLNRTETAFLPDQIALQYRAKDYLGWSTTPDLTGMVITNDPMWNTITGNEPINTWDQLRLTEDVYDYTFYAIFQDHKWNISFETVAWDGKSTVAAVPLKEGEAINYSIVNGNTLYEPATILANPYENDLGLYERVRFIGYTDSPKGGPKSNNIFTNEEDAILINFNSVTAVQDKTYYAAWVLEDVHEVLTDISYFNFYETSVTLDDVTYKGYKVTPKEGKTLVGKVTIPAQYEGVDIISIGSFGHSTSIASVAAPYVTHIFFEAKHPLKYIDNYAFRYCQALKYFEFANLSTLYEIGRNAFSNINNLIINYDLGNSVKYIGPHAFNGAFGKKPDTDAVFSIPGSVIAIGRFGIAQNNYTSNTFTYQIGNQESRSNLSLEKSAEKYFNSYAYQSGSEGGTLLDQVERAAIAQSAITRLKSLQIYHILQTEHPSSTEEQQITVNGVTIAMRWSDFMGLGVDSGNASPVDNNGITWY